MVTVEAENLVKRFNTGLGDEVVAVDDVSFTVEGNEILTLVGPSGCGKTTTLRCVSGLETPTTGAIKFDGEDVTDKPPQERNIAMLFQDIALWPHMTVRENMVFSLRIKGEDVGDIKSRVEAAAEELKIEDKLDQKPAQLSGGQRQRVALGRAIVQDPDLFLFDEPLSALDAALKREIQPLIKRIVKDAGVPAIYVTHDQQEAMNLSDKIAVMNEGKVEQLSQPLSIYQAPTNRFVGEFIGNPRMNFLSGEATRNGDASTVDLDGLVLEIDESIEGSVRFGVRPQYTVVRDDGEPGIEARHLLDEPQGDETHSYFDTDHGEQIAVTSAGFRGEEGTYRLSFDPDEVHVFDDEGVKVAAGVTIRE